MAPPEPELVALIEELDIDAEYDDDAEEGEEPGVTELDMSDKGLTSVPAVVFRCTSLVGLYLEDNELEKLEEDVGDLKELEELYLRRCKLAMLPSALGAALPKLDSLYLEDNQLTEGSFPESFGQLSALKGLTLHRNQLAAIPAPVLQVTSLVELYLDSNSVAGDLPEAIGDLVALREIGLGNNAITGLPASFGNLVALQVCHLEGNLIEKLPKTLGGLASLKRLYIQNNLLGKLHSCLGKCESLEVINAEDCKLKGVAKRIADLPKLKHLLLANNELTALPDCILADASKLRRFTLSGNIGLDEGFVQKMQKLEEVTEE